MEAATRQRGDDTRAESDGSPLVSHREERENQRLQLDVETLNKTRKIPKKQNKLKLKKSRNKTINTTDDDFPFGPQNFVWGNLWCGQDKHLYLCWILDLDP